MTSEKKSDYWGGPLALAVLAPFSPVLLFGLLHLGLFSDNFRVVTPGKFYRSGQMDGKEIQRVVGALGIRTIVNLRGEGPGRWYPAEVRAARQLGVNYSVIAMSSDDLPEPQKLAALLQVFRLGPYPIWVHCMGGSDRSGLVSAIYRIVVEQAPCKAAMKEQLTWRYGHWGIGDKAAMDDFFRLYLHTGGGKDLARWIVEDYPLHYIEQRPAKAGE